MTPRVVRLSAALHAVSALLAAVIGVLTIDARHWFGAAYPAYAAAVSASSLIHNPGPGRAVGHALLLDLAIVGTVVLSGLLLAVLVQRRARRGQVLAWCAAPFLLFGLGMVALIPDTASAFEDPTITLYFSQLLPPWYPTSNAVLGSLAFLALLAAAVLLTRSSVVDFYRDASNRPDDPRWAAFSQRQRDLMADGER